MQSIEAAQRISWSNLEQRAAREGISASSMLERMQLRTGRALERAQAERAEQYGYAVRGALYTASAEHEAAKEARKLAMLLRSEGSSSSKRSAARAEHRAEQHADAESAALGLLAAVRDAGAGAGAARCLRMQSSAEYVRKQSGNAWRAAAISCGARLAALREYEGEVPAGRALAGAHAYAEQQGSSSARRNLRACYCRLCAMQRAAERVVPLEQEQSAERALARFIAGS